MKEGRDKASGEPKRLGQRLDNRGARGDRQGELCGTHRAKRANAFQVFVFSLLLLQSHTPKRPWCANATPLPLCRAQVSLPGGRQRIRRARPHQTSDPIKIIAQSTQHNRQLSSDNFKKPCLARPSPSRTHAAPGLSSDAAVISQGARVKRQARLC